MKVPMIEVSVMFVTELSSCDWYDVNVVFPNGPISAEPIGSLGFNLAPLYVNL